MLDPRLQAFVDLEAELEASLSVVNDPTWKGVRIIATRKLETILAAIAAVKELKQIDRGAVLPGWKELTDEQRISFAEFVAYIVANVPETTRWSILYDKLRAALKTSPAVADERNET